MTVLLTARLRLEPITDAHYDGLHAMNSRPEVMRYISGQAETPDETRAGIERIKARWAEWGHSWWALIALASERLVGAGCVQYLDRDRANPLEIGWRLHPDHWGRGYAIEAARALAAFGFERLQAAQLLAVRDPANLASGRVMERLGMVYRGVEHWYDSELAVHALSRQRWEALKAGQTG